MPRKTITQEEKEFIKGLFEWFQHLENAGLLKDWKATIIDYIHAKEPHLKKESIRRNLNRMQNYYFGTGKQARSGSKKYLQYLKEFAENWRDNLEVMGARPTLIFSDMAQAQIYRGEITALWIVPDTKNMEFWIYRYYPG